MTPARLTLAALLIAAAQTALADGSVAPADVPAIQILPDGSKPAAAPAGPDSCGASAYRKWIGQPFGVIDPMAVTGPIRIIYPTASASYAPLTDSNPARTLIRVDQYDNIVKLSCG